MATLTGNFETGTNGNTIATTDTGSANAWSSIQNTNTGTIVYDNTHTYGTLSAMFQTGSSTAGVASNLNWGASFGVQTEHWGRLYVWMDANPNYGVRIVRSTSSGTFQAGIVITTTGKVQLTDTTGTSKGATTNSISLGQWVRIEYHMIHSATVGFVEAKLFNSPDSTTPTETVTSASNLNTGTSSNNISFGYQSSANNNGNTMWLDNLQSNTTTYPGPALDILTLDNITTSESVGYYSETIFTREAVRVLLASNLAVSDSITVSENVQRNPISSIIVADSVTFSENFLNGGVPDPGVNDTITFTENVHVVLVDIEGVNDTIHLSENSVVKLEGGLHVQDSLTVSENVSLLRFTPASPDLITLSGKPLTITLTAQPLRLTLAGQQDRLNITLTALPLSATISGRPNTVILAGRPMSVTLKGQ